LNNLFFINVLDYVEVIILNPNNLGEIHGNY